MGISAAIVGAGALAAGGSIVASSNSAGAATQAANTQAQASTTASNNTLAMFQEIQQNLSPFLQGGIGGLQTLLGALGLGGPVPGGQPRVTTGINGAYVPGSTPGGSVPNYTLPNQPATGLPPQSTFGGLRGATTGAVGGPGPTINPTPASTTPAGPGISLPPGLNLSTLSSDLALPTYAAGAQIRKPMPGGKYSYRYSYSQGPSTNPQALALAKYGLTPQSAQALLSGASPSPSSSSFSATNPFGLGNPSASVSPSAPFASPSAAGGTFSSPLGSPINLLSYNPLGISPNQAQTPNTLGGGGLSLGAGGQLQYTPQIFNFSPTLDQIQNTPGYQFALNQGLLGTQNQYASQGLGVSGAAGKGLASFAEGLAGTQFQNLFSNALQGFQTNAQQQQFGFQNATQQNQFGAQFAGQQNQFNLQQRLQLYNMLAGLIQSGQASGANLASTGLQSQQIASNFATSAAAAQAAGIVGSTNATNAGILGVTGAGSGAGTTLALLNAMNRGGGSGAGTPAGYPISSINAANYIQNPNAGINSEF